MKNLLFMLIGSLTLTAGTALANLEQGNDLLNNDQKNNFEICAENSQWYNNWGQYVVAFDLEDARKICGSGAQVKQASCKIDGNRVSAGYYCD